MFRIFQIHIYIYMEREKERLILDTVKLRAPTPSRKSVVLFGKTTNLGRHFPF